MTKITKFADQLFFFMALKYELVYENCTDEVRRQAEDYDWPTSDEFTVEIGYAVMMLAYSYRPHFKKQFLGLSTLLSTHDPESYAIIFAEQTYKSHSPLKILVLCSFISELYLFLLYKSGYASVIEDYIKSSSACFNSVYEAVLRDIADPIKKWEDVKTVAKLIDCGYYVFEPLMETEHPSENKDFFGSVAGLTGVSEEDVARYKEKLQKEVRKAETISKRNLRSINKNLYATLKSLSLFPQATQPGISSGASSTFKVGPSESDKMPVSDGSAESSKPSTYCRKVHRKAKLATMMEKEAVAKTDEKELARLMQANDQAFREWLLGQNLLPDGSDTDADLGKFSELTLKERPTDDTVEEQEENVKEYLV